MFKINPNRIHKVLQFDAGVVHQAIALRFGIKPTEELYYKYVSVTLVCNDTHRPKKMDFNRPTYHNIYIQKQ